MARKERHELEGEEVSTSSGTLSCSLTLFCLSASGGRVVFEKSLLRKRKVVTRKERELEEGKDSPLYLGTLSCSLTLFFLGASGGKGCV